MDAGAGGTLAERFAAETATGYREWVAREGLEIRDAFYVPDLNEIPLRPWPRRGGLGVFLNHDASAYSNDCYVCEIPPGGRLAPQRQLYEELIYVLRGQGATSVWNDAGQRCHFEWRAGSLFAVPLNAWHQHFNGSGQAPARFLAVTNAPVVFNLYRDPGFIFQTAYDFPDRFRGEPNYFSGEGVQEGYVWETNFVADLLHFSLLPSRERGGGSTHARFRLANSSLLSHISEFPVGTYKKAHRHGPGAHVIILSGEGYSLMWPEGQPIQRFDWKPGSLIIPPNRWFHQHFNTGREPARYLALKHEVTMDRRRDGVPRAWISSRQGGDQIEYADEDPMVRQMFEEALAKNGLRSQMGPVYATEQARA